MKFCLRKPSATALFHLSLLLFTFITFAARADGIPASAYVQDGLIAQWDGIDNAGTGTHDPAATTWKELKGDLATTPTALTFKAGRYAYFNGTASSGTMISGNFPAALVAISNGHFSVDLRASFAVYTQYAGVFHFGVSSSSRYFSLTGDDGGPVGAFQYKRNGWDANNCKSLCKPALNTVVNVTAMANGSHNDIYLNGELQSSHNAGTYEVSSTAFQFGKYHATRNERQKMNLYAVRLYDRVLAADEMAWNAKIDRLRFDSADSTGVRMTVDGATTNLECRVDFAADGEGTVSATYGDADVASGSWLPDGAVVSMTATPADGMRLVGWSGAGFELTSGQLTDSEITFKIVGSVRMNPVFLPQGTAAFALDKTAKTITHTGDGTVLNVTISGDDLTIAGVNSLASNTELDLAARVFDADYHEYFIRTIASNSLKAKNDLVRIRLPEGLQSIGSYAFQSSTNLVEVIPCVPDSVTYIGDYAFGGCTKLAGRLNMHGCLRIGQHIANNGTKLKIWDFGNPAVITNIATQASDSITNVLPRIFPESCRNFPKMNNVDVKQTLYLCHPEMPTALSGDHARYSGWTAIDMTGSRIAKMGSWSFYGCSSCTSVVFSTAFTTFQNVNPTFGGCSALKWLYFRGGPFEVFGQNPLGCHAGVSYYLPKWNREWEAALAANDYYRVTEMTSAECDNFHKAHPGEPIPVQKLKVNALSSDKGISWWYPDPPPVYETVNLRDLLGYDGVKGVVSGENFAESTPVTNLFDGTTYTYNTGHTSLRWLGSEGATAVLEIPETAVKAREMKLTHYRLHQLCMNYAGNARAPTQWKLEGKQVLSDGWTTIDEVTMTSESANVWAYLTNNTYATTQQGTIPPRRACSLTYEVPQAAQGVYKAFRFTPLDSYSRQNSPTETWIYGLMEIEFLGELTTPDPEIGAFAVAKSEWEDVRFAATVSGLGEQPALGRHAQRAWAWVETATDAEMTDVVSVGAPVEVGQGTEATLVGAGLAGNTAYYARLVVSNDLEAVVRSDPVECATLGEPWIVSTPVCSTNALGNLVVTIEMSDLYTNAVTMAFGYAETPAADPSAIGEARTVTAAGSESATADFKAADELGMGVVTITCGDLVRVYMGAAHTWWEADDPASPTKIVNPIDGTAFNVTVSGTDLTLKSVITLGDVTDFDFSLPIWSGNGATQFSLKSVGTVFYMNSHLTSVILPDTMTSVPENAFRDCTALARVHLPTSLTTIGNSAFNGCVKLEQIEPLLPPTCLTIGMYAFNGCKKLPDPVLPEGITTIRQFTFGGSGIHSVTIPDSVTQIDTDAFSSCGSLTNFLPRFLPPQVTAFSKFEGSAIMGRLVVDLKGWKVMIGDQFRYLGGITEADFSQSGLTNMGASTTMYGCTSLKKIVFPECFEIISAGENRRNLASCPALREIVFNGAPPQVHSGDIDSAYYVIWAPRYGVYGRAWDDYAAEHPDWFKPVTAAEKAVFRTRFPNERGPVSWINLGGVTGWRYFKRMPKVGTMLLLK